MATCAATSADAITITADTQYVGWQYVLSTGTLSIITTPSATALVPVTGTLKGTLYKVTSAASGGVRTVSKVEPWQYNYPVAPFLPAGSSTALYLQWDDTNKVWTVITGATVSVITSYRYDTSSKKLQYKKTSITVLAAGTEDANWTDVTTATAHTAEHAS
jgi:hypothetical protein